MNTGDAVAIIGQALTDGGPSPENYDETLRAFDAIHRHDFVIQNGVSTRVGRHAQFEALVSSNRDVFQSTALMQGFARLKPHGYSGDFEIIERIYNRSLCGISSLQQWDYFFHAGAAPQAVRNRAKLLASITADRRPRSILTVGCGPALDICGIGDAVGNLDAVTLIDNDAAAVRRAQLNINSQLNLSNDCEVSYVTKNALRFRSTERFELIWCSGLMDYFNDKTAIYLMRRFLELLTPGGIACIGNFGSENSSRGYMELVGDWFLIHRAIDDLKRICRNAGFAVGKFDVIADETGVNLFLLASA